MGLSLTLSDQVDLRGALVSLTILRQSYHAPRDYAVYFSKDGNIASIDKQVFDTGTHSQRGRRDDDIFLEG